MKFTLVFPSNESSDLSVGVIFAPCLIWVIGGRHFSNPHPQNPHYILGDFQDLVVKLVRQKIFNLQIKSDVVNKIFIIVHDLGHGNEDYLNDLVGDINSSGFNPIVCR